MASYKKRTSMKKMISEEEAYKAVLQGIREAIREYKVKTKSERGLKWMERLSKGN